MPRSDGSRMYQPNLQTMDAATLHKKQRLTRFYNTSFHLSSILFGDTMVPNIE